MKNNSTVDVLRSRLADVDRRGTEVHKLAECARGYGATLMADSLDEDARRLAVEYQDLRRELDKLGA